MNEAKAREKKYLEDTMDNRIREYARKKSMKMSSAAENVTQFAYTPIDRQAATPFDLSVGKIPLSATSQYLAQRGMSASAGYIDGEGINDASIMSSVTNPMDGHITPSSKGKNRGVTSSKEGTSRHKISSGGTPKTSRGIYNNVTSSQGLEIPAVSIF